MPVLTIYGLTNESELMLQKLREKLCEAVASVEALELTAKQVSVFFPVNKAEKPFYKETICFVDGLFEKPERTEDIRNQLASVIGKLLKFENPNDLVEVFVRSFHPVQGFWTSAKEE
ncbi:hypothetical protein KJ885_05170 [Patescibacteria group bacterium]|nr:hypothetical protein [Patescibacteria group bacterium]